MRFKPAVSVVLGALALLGIAASLRVGGIAPFSADPCARADGRALIRPAGDTVCLPGVATVSFPTGTFAAPTEVALRTTSDQDVAKLFRNTTAMFLTAGRLEYELRVATAARALPAEDAQITMSVPDELLRYTLTGHKLEAFAAIERGSAEAPLSMFEFLESSFDPAAGTISFQLPKLAFAANPLTGGEVQAIVTLAPTLSGGDCH